MVMKYLILLKVAAVISLTSCVFIGDVKEGKLTVMVGKGVVEECRTTPEAQICERITGPTLSEQAAETLGGVFTALGNAFNAVAQYFIPG